MALIEDIVMRARRILGDVKKHRWSDTRMLDLANSGMRDINKQTGAFVNEYVIELQKYRYRYPLPVDLLQITSINYMGIEVPIISQTDKVTVKQFKGMVASKDQLNRGVLEVGMMPDISSRLKRFVTAPTLFETGEDGELIIEFNPDEGVIDNGFGIVTSFNMPEIDYNTAPPSTFGIMTDIVKKGVNTTLMTVSEGYLGVMTDIAIKGDYISGGFITDLSNEPTRVVGRYGIITGALNNSEYIKVRYKSVPPEAKALSDGFPLALALEETLVYWIVANALLDDNDANNMQRADKFMNLYMRELQIEYKMNSKNYSRNTKRGITYTGGIIK